MYFLINMVNQALENEICYVDKYHSIVNGPGGKTPIFGTVVPIPLQAWMFVAFRIRL